MWQPHFQNWVLICSLFNDTFSVTQDYTASNERMIGERMWKEADVAQFKVISWHLPAGTEENHEKPVKIAGLLVEI
jgi:hypothetical protein